MMATAKPTKNQLKFLDWEFGVFFHFGIRTFYEGHRDWDGHEAEMVPAGFDPPQIDCDGWIRSVKEGGAKYAILTAKHHDGFANWPSAYSDYSVKNTPYKNGKGDVVREFTDACRKYGIGVGLYYSPAQFGFTFVDAKAYDDYFVNQMTELLSNYGKIDYLWFDGCGSGDHQYDWGRIIGEIRRLQPDIMIFGFGNDTGWVGNEEGVTPFGMPNGSATAFCPYECDCKMRRDNWFFSEKDEDRVRSVDDLCGLWYYSVGRGNNLLLNIGPDREGKLPEKDVAALLGMRRELDRRFAAPIPYTLQRRGDRFVLHLEKGSMVNTVVLSEDLTDGQKIRAFSIGSGDDNMHLYDGKCVGHKQIVTFPPYYFRDLCLEITDAEEGFVLKSVQLYYVR